jgi:hypothetical protein
MKNIHLLPTDKRTRLYFSDYGKELNLASHPATLYHTGQHLYITSDEEIKEGDYGLIGKEVGKIILTEDGYEFLIGKGVSYEYGDYHSLQKRCKKIILTTDKDLISDGVQAIDDAFLEWFVKNPSCEEVRVLNKVDFFSKINDKLIYKIIIPKEELKQETINYATINVVELWHPSMQLRFLEKAVAIDEYTGTMKMILQQLYMSNLGNQEWRDVPTETL